MKVFRKKPSLVHILLAEDDQNEARAFVRTVAQLGITNPVTVVKNGLEAWAILQGKNRLKALPKPQLLVLNLHMPKMGGLELLHLIRHNPAVRDSVVFMLTDSKADEEIIEASDLTLAGYMRKSEVQQSFLRVMQLVNSYYQKMDIRQPIITWAHPEGDRRRYIRHPDARGVL